MVHVLTENKAYSTTLNYIEDTIRAVKDPDLSKYHDEQLSLVGVSLETLSTINPDILAEPQLKSVRRGVDNRLEVGVTLKPDVNEGHRMFSLNAVLNATEQGFVENFDKSDQEKPTSLARYMDNNTPLSDIQDYNVQLYFYPDTAETTYREFVINGNRYKQFTLKASPDFEGEPYPVALHFLTKVSEGIESFFSAYTKEDLNKTTTKKLLDTICDRNITGLFIGSLYYTDRNIKINTQAFTTLEGKHEIDEEQGVDAYDFYTHDTYVSVDEDRIEGSIVIPVQANKYTFKVFLKGGGSFSIVLG